jgi:protein-tyrosine phosphatase
VEIFPVDERRMIFISPDIDDWKVLEDEGITVIIDVDAGIDNGVPTIPNHILYVYFPFIDDGLPDLDKLNSIAVMGAELYRSGKKILVHCAMGYNRSALVIGMILVKLGMSGKKALELIQNKRKGALYNMTYSEYLLKF